MKHINMKYSHTFIMITFFISICTSCAFSQEYPNLFKTRPYKMWVKPMNNTKVQKVYLSELQDSSIIYRNYSDFKTSKLMISDIKQLDFRRKEKIGRTILYGALSGFAFGGLIGLASGDDSGGFISFTAEEKALVLGTMGGITGVIVGAIVGTMKIKIPIEGKHEEYINQKEKLKTYIIEYP